MKKTTWNFYQVKIKRATHRLLCVFTLVLMCAQSSWGQATLPLYDGLDYTAGAQLFSGTNWGYNGAAAATNDMPIVAGSLSYPGLLASTGNKTGYVGGGDDATLAFTTTSAAGTTVYYSYLLNITDATNLVLGYAVGLINAATLAASGTAPGSGSIAALASFKPGATANTFNIGFSGRANQTAVGTTPTSLIYDTTDRPVGTPVLIVCSITFVTGTANDIVRVWINPTPGGVQPTPSILAAGSQDLTTSTDLSDVAALFLRQNGNTSTPPLELDEFRVGLNWADVTPAAPLATTDFKADSSANVYVYGNQVFVSNVKSNTTVAVYSVSGALVKTIETSSDTSFDLGSGVWIAKVKSAEGEKSVKLLVK